MAPARQRGSTAPGVLTSTLQESSISPTPATTRSAKISGGIVTTLAGVAGTSGRADGASGTFGLPTGVATDAGGNIYVADWANNSIRMVTSTGVVSTITGSLTGLPASTDSTLSAALFRGPRVLSVDQAGIIYDADRDNATIRRIDIAGNSVTTLAGWLGAIGGL